MIVQIQGTSGSGKSTLVRELMEWGKKRGQLVARDLNKRGKPQNYCIALSARERIYIVGSYVTPCGGCDQVGSSEEVLRRVRAFAKKGHVVFEGLLLSGGQGTLGRAMLRYGDGFAYAFLDTPLETCLDRVQRRREARAAKMGVLAKPLNPKNTASKWLACKRYREKCLGLGYKQYALLPHKRPLPGLLKLLGVRP